MSAGAPAGAAAAPSARSRRVLGVERVDVSYGAVRALSGVSIEVRAGEVVTLLGANGAGKTTLLRTITSLVAARAGEIAFHDEDGRTVDLRRTPAHRLIDLGIAHVPEGRGVFGALTVRENLLLGAYRRRDPAGMREDAERVYTLFPRLAERVKQRAGTLSGGEQQMLAIGRALMGRPRVLLMDEPSLGIAPVLVRTIFDTIGQLNREGGMTILLVEQNARLALEVAHRGYVLEAGQLVLEGTSAELSANEDVRSAYLGG